MNTLASCHVQKQIQFVCSGGMIKSIRFIVFMDHDYIFLHYVAVVVYLVHYFLCWHKCIHLGFEAEECKLLKINDIFYSNIEY